MGVLAILIVVVPALNGWKAPPGVITFWFVLILSLLTVSVPVAGVPSARLIVTGPTPGRNASIPAKFSVVGSR